MSKIVDFYTVHPDELMEGDVMVCVVTLHVMRDKTFRMYKCHYPPQLVDSGVPQGVRIGDEDKVAHSLFPVTTYAEMKPDYY